MNWILEQKPTNFLVLRQLLEFVIQSQNTLQPAVVTSRQDATASSFSFSLLLSHISLPCQPYPSYPTVFILAVLHLMQGYPRKQIYLLREWFIFCVTPNVTLITLASKKPMGQFLVDPDNLSSPEHNKREGLLSAGRCPLVFSQAE